MSVDILKSLVGWVEETVKAINEGKGVNTVESLDGMIKHLMDMKDEKEIYVLELKLIDLLKASKTNHLPAKDKLCIVWDLDGCLISSQHLGDSQPKELKTTVTDRSTLNEIIHVDDDLIKFKTYSRNWSRLVLTLLRPLAFNFVFTSATRGYMKNVVSLLEPKEGDLFESLRLSRNDFPERELQKFGKRIRTFTDEVAKLKGVSKDEVNLQRMVLLDDNHSYLSAQPFNGIVVELMANEKPETDNTLFDVFRLLLPLCSPNSSVSTYLETHHHNEDYWLNIFWRELSSFRIFESIEESRRERLLKVLDTSEVDNEVVDYLSFVLETKFNECDADVKLSERLTRLPRKVLNSKKAKLVKKLRKSVSKGKRK